MHQRQLAVPSTQGREWAAESRGPSCELDVFIAALGVFRAQSRDQESSLCLFKGLLFVLLRELSVVPFQWYSKGRVCLTVCPPTFLHVS